METIDKSVAHGIGSEDTDDGNRCSRGFQRGGRTVASKCSNHNGVESHQLQGERREAIVVPLGPAVFNRDTASFGETCRCEGGAEFDDSLWDSLGRLRMQEPDQRLRDCLLAARCNRPSYRAAKDTEELSPLDTNHGPTRQSLIVLNGGEPPPALLRSTKG